MLAVTAFSDLKEAIALANATEYGLAAMIWTSDLATAHVAARSLHAGIVWVNTAQLLDNAVPYGGHLQSGVGIENGLEGILDYTQSKSVFMNTAPWCSPWQ